MSTFLMQLPLINLIINVVGIALIVSGGLVLFSRSRLWTGPAQAAALEELSSRVMNVEHRTIALEDNTSLQYQTLTAAMDAFRTELRHIGARVGHIAAMTNRVSSLEQNGADLQQEFQFFKDLGCGHPECPRNRGSRE